MNTEPNLGETFETFVSAGKVDINGRHIGYIVGLRDNGTDFYAWVQNARSAKGGPSFDGYKDFGVIQRSKRFDSQEAATRWAYCTARERIAKLK